MEAAVRRIKTTVVCSLVFALELAVFALGFSVGSDVSDNKFEARIAEMERRVDYVCDGLSDVTDMAVEMWNFLGGK